MRFLSYRGRRITKRLRDAGRFSHSERSQLDSHVQIKTVKHLQLQIMDCVQCYSGEGYNIQQADDWAAIALKTNVSTGLSEERS